jgi:hypothetical protein
VLAGTVSLSVLGLAGCGGSPTGPSPLCRTYATAVTLNGGPGTCAFDGRTYVCRFGTSSRSWTYASTRDFVREARTPNRVLAQARHYSGGGSMLISYSSHSTIYSYDAQGRLTERRRTSESYLGSCVLDATVYDRWDGVGRPLSGEMVAGSERTPLTIDYDDAARTAEASNGELSVRDGNGNLVREVEFAGYPPKDYVVTATAEVCE